MSDEDGRIRGGNGDFNSAQTSFRSSFWTILFCPGTIYSFF